MTENQTYSRCRSRALEIVLAKSEAWTFVSEMRNTSGEREGRKNPTDFRYSTNKNGLRAVELSKTVSAEKELE